MENTKNIIELKHITKTYEDGFTAVSDFNLEVKQGEFITFLGPSGCGKTTTLRMIAGFDIPSGGEILLMESRSQNCRRISGRSIRFFSVMHYFRI